MTKEEYRLKEIRRGFSRIIEHKSGNSIVVIEYRNPYRTDVGDRKLTVIVNKNITINNVIDIRVIAKRARKVMLYYLELVFDEGYNELLLLEKEKTQIGMQIPFPEKDFTYKKISLTKNIIELKPLEIIYV